MINKKIFTHSLGYSVGAIAYIAVIAMLMRNADAIFGRGEETILIPVGVLLLLVVSVATMGMLVFGKPLTLYIDGKKREGVAMAACTIGLMAAFTVILFVIMILVRG